MSGDKTIRVTGQAGLDEALAKPSSDDVVIVIDSHPGDFISNYVFVMDSRGHAVEACGESRVVVSGHAQLTARGHSMVEAQDDAVVRATDFAQVNWRDSSSGTCGYYARGQAWDTAKVETRALCPLFAHDSAEVTARSASRVVAQGNASVYAYNQAVVYCEGGEVYAHDHATVYVLEGADRPSVEGVPTVVVHDFAGDTPVTGGPVVLTA